MPPEVWTEQAVSLWGKTDPDAFAGQASWLPLVRHLEDTAAVAAELWRTWVPRAEKERLGSALALSEDDVQRLYVFLSAVHDIGKATPTFNAMAQTVPGMDSLCTRARDAGLTVPYAAERVVRRHWETGHKIFADWVQEMTGCSSTAADPLASIVGAHHGRPPKEHELNTLTSEHLGVPTWSQVHREILEHFAKATGVSPLLVSLVEPKRLTRPAQMILTSLVVMADWIASNAELLPYTDPRSSEERARAAVEALDLGHQWLAEPVNLSPDDLFEARFPGLTLTPMQRAVCEAAQAMSAPGLLVIEDAMGSGKTEAAFLAAEVLAAKFGLNGTFIGLPTMATSNPMFDRCMEWLGNVGDRTSVNLMHSKAFLHNSYAQLQSFRWRDSPCEHDPQAATAYIASWFRGRHKGLLANHTVGTVDQALLGALKAKHVQLRLFALASKVVIIDEVHAADEVMRTFAERLLEWLGAFGTPVILMSATLPSGQRQQLIQAYARGRGVPAAADALESYPRLTVAAGEVTAYKIDPAASERSVRLERFPDDLLALLALLQEKTDEGGCVAVIRNSVGRAQETYAALRAVFRDDVVLLHSRFLAPHRAARERALVAELGKPVEGRRRPRRRIVVGTQVLEQSLDIDVDLMVSDLAPADLVLQRIGRLHRHRGWDTARPPGLADPVCYLTGVEVWADPPRFVRPSVRVYGESALLRAASVLPTTLRLPTDVGAIVEEAYRPLLPAPAGWEDVWSAAEVAAVRESETLRARAKSFLLERPTAGRSLLGLLDVTDEVSAQRQSVRDGEDSLEVVVAQRNTSGELRLSAGVGTLEGLEVPEQAAPSDDVARALAACTVSLPRWTDPVITELECTTPPAWETSPWLKGQLLLDLDAAGHRSVGRFSFTYAPETGLTVETKEVTA